MLLLFLLLVVATSSTSPVTGVEEALPVVNPISCLCNSTTSAARTYLPSSRFAANLARASLSVPANASASGGFFKGSIGAAPDTLYALALCRGDIPPADCASSCLEAAFQYPQVLCNRSRDVTLYYDQCQIRFSDQDFLAGAGNEPETAATNMDNISVPVFPGWDPGNGDSVSFIRHRHRVYVAARDGQAGGVQLVGEVRHHSHVHAGLSPDACFGCLEDIIQQSFKWFDGRQVGRIQGVRCVIRYETDAFFVVDEHTRYIGPTKSTSTSSPLAESTGNGSRSKIMLSIIATVVALLMLLLCSIIGFGWIRAHRKGKVLLQDNSVVNLQEEEAFVWTVEGNISSEFSLFDVAQIQEATSNFSDDNKLGQGGFGPVYKGKLPNGQEIAVKKLSTNSGQGFIEFKNEVQLIAKLQHTNLVRLLGCSSQREEKLLVYEYLPNKSLDSFIFDKKEKRALLDWEKRQAIIEGIAHGLLYLHKHSRLRVIHRDLKASNILLDKNMNPKISDFGLAKIFSSNNSEGNTNRVVGTYGYMAPEYASEGFFSIKSDVFSFGVLLLEIVSGKRNSGFRLNGGFLNLLGYAWELWTEGKWHELVDTSLAMEHCKSELLRCINIALLCVQENADDRPAMWDVATMLSTEGVPLPEPKHPAYYNVRVTNTEALDIDLELYSINEVTITAQQAR
ncbi:hypothetical protein SETIT_5G190000v2 [Setaria italica]|uniref:non-specific serine/threonine protein kinase n=1 Tax=Setaria italica TaxID=4555 RepID=A0A368R6P0_SETIT|nr:hypothetical protein SETIT_5G190000v2 [Setaria italica]